MCFKRLYLLIYVLNETGSPASSTTIDDIRSFHTLLLQSPDENLVPEPPDIIKKDVPTIFGTVGPSRKDLPKDSWHDDKKMSG